MTEEKEDHKREGHDGDDGGDGDELGSFDIITTVFGSEKTKNSGGRKGLDKSTDIDDLDREFEGDQGEVSHERTDYKLNSRDENEAPFLDKSLEFGMREHVADTDNRQWRGGTADEADSVGNEAGELEAGKKNNHAE